MQKDKLVYGWNSNGKKKIMLFTIILLVLLIISLFCCLKLRHDLDVSDSQVQELLVKNVILTEQDEKLKRYNAYPVLCTVYNPTVAQCDSTPHITASGERVTERTIAVSKEMEQYLPLGSKVQWENKLMVVEDRMNQTKIKGLCLDRCSFKVGDFKEKAILLVPFRFKEYREKIIKEAK